MTEKSKKNKVRARMKARIVAALDAPTVITGRGLSPGGLAPPSQMFTVATVQQAPPLPPLGPGIVELLEKLNREVESP